MEFSTDGESLPSSQKHRHSAIHVTRSDGVFACCSTSCSNSCSCRRCCLLLDSAAAAAAAESENNNKERREGEGMEEEQQTEPEPLEDEQDCCVFKQHCQQVLPGGEVTTNRADLNSVSSFYMDSNISEGESDMEDIQVICESLYSRNIPSEANVNTRSTAMAFKGQQSSLSASTSPQSYLTASSLGYLGVKSPLSGVGGAGGGGVHILKSSSADVVMSPSSLKCAIYSRAAPGVPQGSTLASGSSERFGGGGGPISSQPSSCGKLFHEIAAANASVFAGKDLTGHGVGAAGNSSAAAAFGNGRYELLRSVSGPTTKATTASPSEKSCYSANASSDVKTVLQRHILSKRLSANAVLALNSKLNQQHVAAAAAASGAGIVSSGLSHTFSSQSLQTSPSSNNSSAHHSPPHRDQRSLQHQLSSGSLTLTNSTGGVGTGPHRPSAGAGVVPISSSFLLHPISAALSSPGSIGGAAAGGGHSQHSSRMVAAAAAYQRHNQAINLAAGSSSNPSNNNASNGANFLGMEHNMEQQPKRSLTLSNSYGITATQKDVADTEAVQLHCAKEPLRKTYSEPNLKMLRCGKLKLHTHHYHNQQQQQQRSHLEQGGRAYSTIEEHPLTLPSPPSGGGGSDMGPPLQQNIHTSATHPHANRLNFSAAAAAALHSSMAAVAVAANKQHLLATLSSGGVPPGVMNNHAAAAASSPLFGGLPAFMTSSGTSSHATKRSSVDLLQPPLAKSKTMSFLAANTPDLALNFGCNQPHGVSSNSPGQPSFGHFRNDRDMRSPSSDDYHSPLRIRLSDESSCGSLSPHVPAQVSNNGSSDGSNSSAVNISKSSSFHGSTAPAGATGFNFHPSPNIPSSSMGGVGTTGGGVLLGTNLKQPSSSSFPTHPSSQTSRSHHGRFLTPSPTSNSAANSAILHPGSSSSSSPLENNDHSNVANILGAAATAGGGILSNMSLPSPSSHLRQQQLHFSPTAAAAAVLQQHHLNQVAAAAASVLAASKNQVSESAAAGSESGPGPAAAAAVMAAAVAARYNISSNDVTNRVAAGDSATSANEFTSSLHRHLSESSISSSNDGNSHPPLRRILGNAPNIPAVPPMPALLPFGASSSGNASAELAAVAAASANLQNQQQQTPFKLVNSTSMSAIPSSSSLFAAGGLHSPSNPNNSQNPASVATGGASPFGAQSSPAAMAAAAVNNKTEFDKLFNYYYNAYSNAAALAAAISAGAVPSSNSNTAVAAAECNQLLVPATRYAHAQPPKVVIQPPPPTPQFAEMQLSSSSDSSSSTSSSSQRHTSRTAGAANAHHTNSTENVKGPGVQALEAKLQQKKKNQLLSRNASSSSSRSSIATSSSGKFDNHEHVMNDCERTIVDQMSCDSGYEMSDKYVVSDSAGGESSISSSTYNDGSDPRKHQKMASWSFQESTNRQRYSDSSCSTITPPSGSGGGTLPPCSTSQTGTILGYMSSSPESTSNDCFINSSFSSANIPASFSPVSGVACSGLVSVNDVVATTQPKQTLSMQHSFPECSPSNTAAAGHASLDHSSQQAPPSAGVVLKKHQIFMMHSLQNLSTQQSPAESFEVPRMSSAEHLQGGVPAEGEDRTICVNKNDSNERSHSTVHKMTGLGYNPAMLKHSCTCSESEQHIETPLRLRYVWMRLLELDIPKHCRVFLGRETTLEELKMVHYEKYAQAFSGRDEKVVDELKSELFALPCGGLGVDVDLVWNIKQSPEACLSAVGVLLELTEKVATSHLSNAFALVRPPGHHAEAIRPLGFSYFNNIAIAAKNLLKKKLAQRILIVDWDVHHGNGTEQAFESDPNVLYISIHRYDDGSFFPGTGSPSSIGRSSGTGSTVNVGFSSSLDVPMADEDYMAAFRAVVIPFAQHFQPDVVLVSAGFDASRGHSKKLGGYIVSPECFGWMTKQLLGLAKGKVVLCLEGGFELKMLTESIVACICQLLYASSNIESSNSSSCSSSINSPGGGVNSPLGVIESGITGGGVAVSVGGVVGAGGIYSPGSSPSHLVHQQQQSAFMRRMHPPLVKKTSLDALPSPEAIRSIEQTLQAHVQYWPQQLIKFAQKQLHISQSEADSLQSQQSQSSQQKTTTGQNEHHLHLHHNQKQLLSSNNNALSSAASSPSSSPSSTYSPLSASSTPRISLATPIFTSNQLFDAKVKHPGLREMIDSSKISSSLCTKPMPIRERSNTLEQLQQMPVPMDES